MSWIKLGLDCWRFCKERAQQWSRKFNVIWLRASICWRSTHARVGCQGHAGMLKCTWAWCGGTQTQPRERPPAEALPGSSDTYTAYIYIYTFFYAYVCKLQCLGWTSQLPSAVHSVKYLTVREPEQSRVLQKSHSRSISVHLQRRSSCWPWEQRRFASTRKNQRFSHCLPLHFLHLTLCFFPGQLTYMLHCASNGRKHIKIQGILYILPTFFIIAIDVMY